MTTKLMNLNLNMSVNMKNQGNETHLFYPRIQLMPPRVTAVYLTNKCSKSRSRLCLTLLMMSAFLTVQYVDCQQLLSAINTFRDNHKRETQQQFQKEQQQQQIRYISNILNMENSFQSSHPGSANFFIKYGPINNNANIWNHRNIHQNNRKHDNFSNNTQILIVLNETLHSRNIGLTNKKYRSLDLNEHLRINYFRKPYLIEKDSSNNKQYSNSSREPISKTHYAAGNKKFVEKDLDVIYKPDKEYDPFANNIDSQKLLKLVMDGLGLLNLPDMDKVNISQQEYVSKYKEYVKRVNDRNKHELSTVKDTVYQRHWKEEYAPLHMLSIVHNSSNWQNHFRHRRDLQTRASHSKVHHQKDKTSIILHFPVDLNATHLLANEIEEANIKILLIASPSLAIKRGAGNARNKHHHNGGQKRPTTTGIQPRKHFVNIKVYQLLEKGQCRWLDGRKVPIELDRTKVDESKSHWLEFDVTKAVQSWLSNRQSNLGLEVKCENCYRHGARIIDDLSVDTQEYNKKEPKDVKNEREPTVQVDSDRFNFTPVLNVIGRLGASYQEHRSRERFSEHAQHYLNAMKSSSKKSSRKADCNKDNQRCCRHPMQVVFKEIKGFEFIIQPKVFDAGFCRGRCPPRYNPAHHHAMLQSLIWKQNRTRVPRPCCAPSKLVELEVLHVDEKNSDKLKISTWTDMRVLECACS